MENNELSRTNSVERLLAKGVHIPLFDIDGTLLADTNSAYDTGFSVAVKKVFNIDAKKREIDPSGKTDSQIFYEVLTSPNHNLSEKDVIENLESLATIMADYFIAHANEGTYTPLPGALSLFKEITRREIPIGVLTGNTEAVAWERLAQVGMKDFIEFGSFGNLALERRKLVPIAKERAEVKYGISSIPIEAFVIIGDTPADIKCARDNNIKSIGIPTGNYSKKTLEESGANLVIDSLEEIEKILNFLNISS